MKTKIHQISLNKGMKIDVDYFQTHKVITLLFLSHFTPFQLQGSGSSGLH